MPSNDDVLLLDTSAALALIDPSSTHHSAVLGVTRGRRLGLSGHAMFELYSVTTRLPYPARLGAVDASRLITVNFPYSQWPDESVVVTLIAEFAEAGIVGGAVFDGLVSATARACGCRLVSCDRRAQPTYERLGVDYTIVS